MNYFSYAKICTVAVLLLICGCSDSAHEDDIQVRELLKLKQPTSTVARQTQMFDLGHLIAQGQTVYHSFTLQNDTHRSLKLVEAVALTPCCSSIGPLPKTVRAGESVKVPVSFQVGRESGLKTVKFEVYTDMPDCSTWFFGVSATRYAEVEIIPSTDSVTSLAINKSGQARFQLICRRIGDQGREHPKSVKATGPLRARFTGLPILDRTMNGLETVSRTIEVDLPIGLEPGMHNGEIQFDWEGRAPTWRYQVDWKVIPYISSSPSSLSLRSSRQPVVRDILVRSNDRPFRIVKVTSSYLAEDPALNDSLQMAHRLRLTLRRNLLETAPGSTDITIFTDHPEQQIVKVTTFELPGDSN